MWSLQDLPNQSEPLVSSGTTIRLDAYIANRLAIKTFRRRTFLLCLLSANPDSATRSKLLCIREYGRVSIAIFIDWICQVCIIEGAWVLYPCISESNSACKGTALDPNSQHDIQPGDYVTYPSPPPFSFLYCRPLI